MKRKSCVLLVGILGFGAVVLILLVILVVGTRGSISQELPEIARPHGNPILITLTGPTEGGTFPSNGMVPVLVELSSEQPLQGLRFWLDGAEIGTAVPDVTAISTRFAFPSTLLTGEGWHSLYAGAVDQSGRVTLSNVVHIKGSPPVGTETIYVTSAGDTVNSIAEALQADPVKIQARNPGWAGGVADALPAGKAVIIPFDPPLAPSQTAPGFEGMRLQFNSNMPKPPSIQVKTSQCTVSITLQDLADGASGFILYRLGPGDDSLTPIASYESDQKSPLVYQDKDAVGTVQYAASVYTGQGESLGDPVVVTLTDPGCTNPSTLPVFGNILTLPPAMNGAYFYASVDGNGYQRYPASDGEFLTLKDGAFNLAELPGAQGVQSEVAVEAWGWNSGQLSRLGTALVHVRVKPALSVCPTGTNCGGTGELTTHYSDSAVVGSDQENQSRAFKWEITAPLPENYASVLFQLSLQPFSAGSQDAPPGLVYSKLLSGAVTSESAIGGTFNLDFRHLGEPEDGIPAFDGLLVNPSEGFALQDAWLIKQYEKYNPENTGGAFLQVPDANLTYGFFSIPRTYYARIIPLSGGKLMQSPSNVVTIEYKPTGTGDITVTPTNPSIYDIEIVSSTGPVRPSSHWGCVDVLAVNPDSWVWNTSGSWFKGRLAEFEGYRDNHQPYCPPLYTPEPKAWYEDLWDWVNEGLDAINDAYQAAKKLSVDSMLAQYDLIGGWELCPLPDCRDKVFDGLMTGQEWVLKETYGLPADIPNLSQLTDDEIDVLAEEALKVAGLDGDSCPKEILDCKKLLTDATHKLKEEFIAQSVASYQDNATAHSHNYYALVLPIDPTAITVQPAVTQNWQMAQVTIRVTRKPGATSLTGEQLSKLSFTLFANVMAVNETCRNAVYRYCVNKVTFNGAPAPCTEQSVVLADAPCEGELFSGHRDILLLAPGESREFTFKLLPRTYWVPEMPDEYKVYNPAGNLDLLYVGAQAEISARLWSNGYMAETAAGPEPFILPDLHPSGLLGY